MPIQIMFHWESGSLNDNGTALLRERVIPYQYFGEQLYAKYGEWFVPVTYTKATDNADDNRWHMNIHIEAVLAMDFPKYCKGYKGKEAIKA